VKVGFQRPPPLLSALAEAAATLSEVAVVERLINSFSMEEQILARPVAVQYSTAQYSTGERGADRIVVPF